MPAMIDLDPHDPLPLYAQLERGVKLAIAGGQLPPGAQLPTVRQLAVELKVNANTVAKVYAELERQGVVATRRGVGTFVVPHSAHEARTVAEPAVKLQTLAKRFLAEAASRGFAPQQLLEEIQRLCANS